MKGQWPKYCAKSPLIVVIYLVRKFKSNKSLTITDFPLNGALSLPTEFAAGEYLRKDSCDVQSKQQ
jgi:hypothetical protein